MAFVMLAGEYKDESVVGLVLTNTNGNFICCRCKDVCKLEALTAGNDTELFAVCKNDCGIAYNVLDLLAAKVAASEDHFETLMKLFIVWIGVSQLQLIMDVDGNQLDLWNNKAKMMNNNHGPRVNVRAKDGKLRVVTSPFRVLFKVNKPNSPITCLVMDLREDKLKEGRVMFDTLTSSEFKKINALNDESCWHWKPWHKGSKDSNYELNVIPDQADIDR